MYLYKNHEFGISQLFLFQIKTFSTNFEHYSYLWMDNKDECLKQFLTYGPQQAIDEQENWNKHTDAHIPSSFSKECSPKLEDFKYQVGFYYSLTSIVCLI